MKVPNPKQPMSWEELEAFLGITLERPNKKNTKIRQEQGLEEKAKPTVREVLQEAHLKKQQRVEKEAHKEHKTVREVIVESKVKKAKAIKEREEEYFQTPENTINESHSELRRAILWSEVLENPRIRRRRRLRRRRF